MHNESAPVCTGALLLCFSIKADTFFKLLFGLGHIVLFQYIIRHTVPLVWCIALVAHIFYAYF